MSLLGHILNKDLTFDFLSCLSIVSNNGNVRVSFHAMKQSNAGGVI